jgi:hypothetical protein
MKMEEIRNENVEKVPGSYFWDSFNRLVVLRLKIGNT